MTADRLEWMSSKLQFAARAVCSSLGAARYALTMSGPDIWGAVVPAWIGGVGSLTAAVVATVALVQSLRTQGGVETLKGAANAAPDTLASSAVRAQSSKSDSTPLIPTVPTLPASVSPVSWTAWHETRGRYRLRNDSTQNGATAKLTGFRDVTPGGDNAASYHGPLPVELAANESVPFLIEKSFVSPSVTAIELTWEDTDGTERKRVIYI